MAEALLQVVGATVRAERAMLLDGVDLTIGRPGVASVILGPNGAGKSVLLRVLNGLIAPDAGEARQSGGPIDAAARRRMALVFQKPVLLRRSVLANLRFVQKSPQACADLLTRVGLADKAHQPARRLSGGEQQRLALARALANRPEILLLDEPTASLDPASALMIERVIAEERARGAAIILVTHDIAQARRLADDVVFLHRGRVLERAPAADFFAAPTTEPARAYLAGRIVL